jgi:hypothetical protein
MREHQDVFRERGWRHGHVEHDPRQTRGIEDRGMRALPLAEFRHDGLFGLDVFAGRPGAGPAGA